MVYVQSYSNSWSWCSYVLCISLEEHNNNYQWREPLKILGPAQGMVSSFSGRGVGLGTEHLGSKTVRRGQAHVCVPVCVWVRGCVCLCVCARARTRMRVHVRVHVRACKCVYNLYVLFSTFIVLAFFGWWLFYHTLFFSISNLALWTTPKVSYFYHYFDVQSCLVAA